MNLCGEPGGLRDPAGEAERHPSPGEQGGASGQQFRGVTEELHPGVESGDGLEGPPGEGECQTAHADGSDLRGQGQGGALEDSGAEGLGRPEAARRQLEESPGHDQFGGGVLGEAVQRLAEDLQGPVGATQPVVEVLGAGQGQIGRLGGPDGAGGLEHSLCLLRPAQSGHGPGERDLRGEARTRVHGGPRQRRGGVEAAGAEHPAGRRQGGLRVDRLPRLQADHGQPARVVTAAERRRLQGVTEPPEQLPPPERGQASAQRLGVEGMGQPHLPAPPVPLRHGGGGDHSRRLEFPDDGGRRQPLQNVEGKWLGESERLGRPALGRGEGAKPLLDGLERASRRHRLSFPAPHAVPLRQGAGPEPDLDQLMEEENVALAQPAQLVTRAGVQVTVERLAEERLHLGPGEGLELDPADGPLLPQPHNRVGKGLAGACREQQRRGLSTGQLMQEGGRGGIEEVGIVDGDHQPPVPSLVAELANAVPEDVERAHGERLREERREGTEGDGRRRLRGGHLTDEPSIAAQSGERLAAEPGLADPMGARDDDAARGRALELTS